MSSILLPKLEITKSTTAFTGLILVLWLLILSHFNVIPDLTNSGALFILVFIALFSTAIINAFIDVSYIGRIQELFLRYPLHSHFRPSPWISDQVKILYKTREFKDLRDGPIAEFILGITVFFLSFTILNEGGNLLTILFAIPEENPNIQGINFQLLAGLFWLLCLALILASFYHTVKQRPKILCLIWYYNIRTLKEEAVHDLARDVETYFKGRSIPDWEGFQKDYQTRVLNPVHLNMSDLLSTVQSIALLNENGFASFFDSVANDPKVGKDWSNFHERSFSDISLRLRETPKLQGLSINGILFGSKTQYLVEGPKQIINDKFGIYQYNLLIRLIRILDSILLNLYGLIVNNRIEDPPDSHIKFIPNYSSKKSTIAKITSTHIVPSKVELKAIVPNTHENLLLSLAVGARFLSSQKNKSFSLRDYDTTYTVRAEFSSSTIWRNIEQSPVMNMKIYRLFSPDSEFMKSWLNSFERVLKLVRDSFLSEKLPITAQRKAENVRSLDLILDGIKTVKVNEILFDLNSARNEIFDRVMGVSRTLNEDLSDFLRYKDLNIF